MATKTERLRMQVRKTGATRYNQRRLLEMYNHDSVLKAARLYPSQEIKASNNINGEPAPRKGFFVKENAEAMDEIIQSINSKERVLVPSHINITGWKEYSADAYE